MDYTQKWYTKFFDVLRSISTLFQTCLFGKQDVLQLPSPTIDTVVEPVQTQRTIPTEISVGDGKTVSLTKAWELVLAEYCGITPNYIAQQWGINEEVQSRARRGYIQAVPQNPTVERYKKDTTRRNSAHYFLSGTWGRVKNPISQQCVDASQLFPTLHEQWYIRRVESISAILTTSFERLLLGNSIIQRADKFSLDPQHVVWKYEIKELYLSNLREAYNSSAEDPWVAAANKTINHLRSQVKRRQLSEVEHDSIISAVQSYVNHLKQFDDVKNLEQEFLKETGENLQKKYVQQIQRQTGITAIWKQASSVCYGKLLAEIIGDPCDFVKRTFADIAKEYEDPKDYKTIQQQTAQVIKYRLRNGLLVPTPIKVQLIEEAVSQLYVDRKDKEIFWLHYGLQGNNPHSIDAIAENMNISPKKVQYRLHRVRQNLSKDILVQLLSDGATDEDLRAYKNI